MIPIFADEARHHARECRVLSTLFWITGTLLLTVSILGAITTAPFAWILTAIAAVAVIAAGFSLRRTASTYDRVAETWDDRWETGL